MKRAAPSPLRLLISPLLLLAATSVAVAQPSDDEGQIDAAKKAGVAAAAAAHAAEKAPEPKKAKAVKKVKKAKKAKAKPDPFGALPDWDAKSPGLEMQPDWDAASGPVGQASFPWVESHGMFRFRADTFHQFDLGTYRADEGRGSSPVLPPLTELENAGSGHPEQTDHDYARGAKTLSSANIRFRYQPTVHVSETLRIKGTIDMLDNLVLGSTPDGGRRTIMSRPDAPLDTFSGSQRPPESGVNGYQDSVRVKQLWGEWRTPLGSLIFGRTASHWGMGILANNGNCLDCDYGDSVDRIMGITRLFDTYLALGWDFPSEGFVGHSGLQTTRTQPGGQPHDFDQRDDVNEWVIAVFDKPLTQMEKAQRVRDLDEIRKPVFDWGVYNVVRSQVFMTENSSVVPAEDHFGETLRDVKAFAYIPDVWLNWEYRPKRNHSFHVQFEAAAILGVIEELPQRYSQPKEDCLDPTIADLADCPTSDLVRPRKRDLQQFGYALEMDARANKLRYGFHHGVASGDDTEGFGVIDKIPLDSTDPRDQEITNFKFDRDYVVDLILFREIIGGVTNAAYFKPYIGYDLVSHDKEAWGFTLSGMYAFALEPAATPGNEAPLGVEFDLELFIHEYDRFKVSLAYGVLFPLGAFDLLDDQETVVIEQPSVAQTLQMMIGMQF